MINASLGSWSPFNFAWEENGTENGTGLSNYIYDFDDIWRNLPGMVISVFLVVISIFGLIGNGTVIWFLGFCIKRNHFTTFILHLAAADLGTLICLFIFSIMYLLVSFSSSFYAYSMLVSFDLISLFFMYNTGQYLLTAISMDRCVSVLFPLWHRCHRPPRFSTLVCAFIWIISFLLTVINMILTVFQVTMHSLFFQLLMNAILCLPLMTVSTLVLFIKVYFRSQQRKKGKAVTAILLALLFFLFLAFPFTFILLIYVNPRRGKNTDMFLGLLFSCLNSSFNPLIYFLVGRKKHSPSRESLKVILQRVFKEEEDGRRSSPNLDLMIYKNNQAVKWL